MQMNNSKFNDVRLQNDIHKIAIPTAVENHIIYCATKKQKYLLRRDHALGHADKPLMKYIITNICSEKHANKSKQKIIYLKSLLKLL